MISSPFSYTSKPTFELYSHWACYLPSMLFMRSDGAHCPRNTIGELEGWAGNHLPCYFKFLPSFSSLLFFLAFGFYFFMSLLRRLTGMPSVLFVSPCSSDLSPLICYSCWSRRKTRGFAAALQLFIFFLFISLYLIWNRLYSLFECDSPFPPRQPSSSYKSDSVWDSLFRSVYIRLYD